MTKDGSSGGEPLTQRASVEAVRKLAHIKEKQHKLWITCVVSVCFLMFSVVREPGRDLKQRALGSLAGLELMHEGNQDGAQDAGAEGAHEDGDLAGVAEVLGDFGGDVGTGEAQGIDKDGHREADTAQTGDGEEHGPGGLGGHLAHLALDGDPGGDGDADGLAEQ